MDDIESATEFFTENHCVTVEYMLENACISKSSTVQSLILTSARQA